MMWYDIPSENNTMAAGDGRVSEDGREMPGLLLAVGLVYMRVRE
jgi:hypothetical protein